MRYRMDYEIPNGFRDTGGIMGYRMDYEIQDGFRDTGWIMGYRMDYRRSWEVLRLLCEVCFSFLHPHFFPPLTRPRSSKLLFPVSVISPYSPPCLSVTPTSSSFFSFFSFFFFFVFFFLFFLFLLFLFFSLFFFFMFYHLSTASSSPGGLFSTTGNFWQSPTRATSLL